MKNLMEKREKIFALVVLFLTNIFCVIKFLVTFVKNTNFFSYMELQQEINKNEIYNLDEIVNFKELSFTKVLLIVSVSFAIILALYSLIFLFIKNKNIKKNLILISFTLAFLVVLFYFTGRLAAGDLYSKAILIDSTEGEYYIHLCETEYYKNALLLIVSVVISIISTFLCFSISNDIHNDSNNEHKEDTIENEQISASTSVEETMLEEEIQKLKAQVRIKNLEDEYLRLKQELDKPSKINKPKKTQ